MDILDRRVAALEIGSVVPALGSRDNSADCAALHTACNTAFVHRRGAGNKPLIMRNVLVVINSLDARLLA